MTNRTARQNGARALLVPPHSEDAEQAVLSACMMDVRAIAAVKASLPASAFYRTAHRSIYGALLTLHDRDETVDPLTLATELDRRGELDTAGGKEFLGYLVDAVPTAANVRYHAKIVREAAQRRSLIEALGELESRAWDESEDLAQLAADIQARVLPLALESEAQGYRHMRDSLYGVLEEIESRGKKRQQGKVSDLATGFPEIDDVTNGFRPGELVVFGGGPKSGKTALTLAIALHNVVHGAGAAFVSAEMTREQLAERCLNSLGLVHTHRTGRGELDQEDWRRLTNAARVIAGHPRFFVDDEAFPTLGDVIARALALKAEHPELPVLVVDYLQLVSHRMNGRRGDEEIAEICRGLKGLAKRARVPVIAPCQTNFKETDRRKNPRPRLRDVQGGSAMVQTSDFVGLVFRPAQHTPTPGKERVIEVDFQACRRTDAFTALLEWAGEFMLVSSPRRIYDTESET